MKINLIEYFEETVKKFPYKIAVKDSRMSITFSELSHNAKIIATNILSKNVINQPIGVYVPKGCLAIQSFCGINYSGNFYVPLDIKSPIARVQTIIDTIDSPIIITDRDHFKSLSSFCNKQILVIEDIINSEGVDEVLLTYTRSRMIDTDPIYSIFTSGSTGTPKGVVISHRGVIDYIDWAIETFKLDDSLIIGNQAPFYFDNSTLDIYLMYATGATLVIIPEENFMFPVKLIEFLNIEKINFIFWVPSVLVSVANLQIFSKVKPRYLRDIFFAGEVMPNKHLNYWRHHLTDSRYANLYGPTEITVDCTYYIVERDFQDNEPLPIGFPCRNSDVLILNEKQELTKTGEHGELCVRGSSLALGYYNDLEKTKKAFIQNPLNTKYPETIYCTGDIVYTNDLGEIIYVGRKDSQIKHNGYRIELGEIETAVLGTHLVDNCCVTYNFINKKIVLFYQAEVDLNLSEFRKSMLSQIPKYMIPTEYNKVSELKCNANGKIDRLYYNNQINK